MPETRAGHAATLPPTLESPQMDADRGPKRLLEEEATTAQTTLGGKLFGSGDDPIAVHFPEKEVKKPLNKRSLDYIVKTGIAGGLAGCAVSELMRYKAVAY